MALEMEAQPHHRAPAPMFPEPEFVAPAGMSQQQFRAMGTTVSLLLPEKQAVEGLAIVRALFEEWEQTLSRFRPESELSHLNQLAGKQAIVSKLLFNVLAEALAAARATDGLYDPTLLNQLTRLGYDRSFDELIPGRPQGSPLQWTSGPEHRPRAIVGAHPCGRPGTEGEYAGQPGGGWRSIQLERAIHRVVLPPGVQLDFGGIAKGMAVDAALERLCSAGIDAALVNAGGDLAVRGLPAGVDHWSIAVPGKAMSWTIPLQRGAMATSGTARRHWWQGHTLRHHLLDPRTGLPAVTDLYSVTVVADRCAQAEVAAKVAFVLGRDDGKKFLNEHQLAGLLVSIDGTCEMGERWPEHLMRRLP